MLGWWRDGGRKEGMVEGGGRREWREKTVVERKESGWERERGGRVVEGRWWREGERVVEGGREGRKEGACGFAPTSAETACNNNKLISQ